MKKTFVLVLSLLTLTISLSACEKTPEEKVAEKTTEAVNKLTSDKERQRLNEMRKQGDDYYNRVLGKKSDSTESQNATKPAAPADAK